MDKLIHVTGATGYIASRLIPRLLDSGYRVRCLARDPLRLQGRSWFNQIDIIQADVTTPDSLVRAFDGVDTAYYLIHNMSAGHGYTKIELDGARNFSSTAEQAGVQHIIYLGGLADPEQHIAPPMRSRIGDWESFTRRQSARHGISRGRHHWLRQHLVRNDPLHDRVMSHCARSHVDEKQIPTLMQYHYIYNINTRHPVVFKGEIRLPVYVLVTNRCL